MKLREKLKMQEENKEFKKVVKEIEREVYGKVCQPNLEKKGTLINNLLNSKTEFTTQEIEELDPIIDELCSLSHVLIPHMPCFPVHELEGKGVVLSKTLMVDRKLVASFSGFIQDIRETTEINGVPCYYFVYDFCEAPRSIDSTTLLPVTVKIVRYIKYCTSNKLLLRSEEESI